MLRQGQLYRVVLLVAGSLVLMGTMGSSCTIIPLFPVASDDVTVELTNLTGNQVQAFLWSDPGTLSDPTDLMLTPPYNLGAPSNPGTEDTLPETVTVTLTCEEAGTLVVDGNLSLIPAGAVASANILLLQEGRDVFCGDIGSFYYEVDNEDVFFTSVDVNDVYLAP